MRLGIALSLFCFAAPPLAAQDPDYCYIGEAPADAPVNSTLPPPMDPFYEAFEVAVARLACGYEIAEDRLLIDGLRRVGGCSDTSEVAGYVDDLFAADFSPLQDALWKRFDTDAEVNAYCASLETCETFADGGYSAACLAAFDAINN